MLSVIHHLVLLCFSFSFTHASLARSSKKRKASVLLHDTNNVVEPVQLVNNDIVMQSTLQQQHVMEKRDVNCEPFRVLMDGGKFFHSISLSHVFTMMISTGHSSLFSNVIAGDHAIGLLFHRTRDMLSLRLSLSSFTKGRIMTQFKVSMNATGGITKMISCSDPTNTQLINGMNILLCRLCDIRRWMQRNAFVDLDIEMLLDPTHHDVPVPCPPWGQEFLKEIRTVPRHLKRLFDQRKYKEIVEFSNNMSNDEFLNGVCSVVETFEQYNGIVDHLKNRNLVTSFYVHGNINVVKEVVVESRVYENVYHVWNGDLETALILAFKNDHHDRVIDLLNIRKEITVEKDRQFKQQGGTTGFEIFVSWFLDNLAPWGDGMALKRFFTLRGDELRDKYPDMLDTLCQELVDNLKLQVHLPNALKLLTDFIGQPSLLTSVSFARGFLCYANDRDYSNFIKYGWDEAVEEGLKKKYPFGGEELWRVMKKLYPNQFIGEYPVTTDALAVVLKYFPTKQKMEERWVSANASDFLKEIKRVIVGVLPTVLTTIVIEYTRPTWIDILSIKP